MGRTSFQGPVYGGKCLLASCFATTAAVSATTEIGELIVPTGEDWYITDVQAYCTNQGNGGTADVESPNGTSLLSADITLSSNAAVAAVVAAAAGEDEGKRVPAGQRIHVEITDGATTAVSNPTVHIYGYIRNAR